MFQQQANKQWLYLLTDSTHISHGHFEEHVSH